ncbi:hypothetical protein HPP92_003474 [Vanilla planifolia]|uniref:Uncharacterized protein n=1 Tax=Vanilla planifolia TaxID=51239 RepID=A0A835S7J3_VANPL|nr:hypothetical protein HPP92_003474 [Vanilla planifolia]
MADTYRLDINFVYKELAPLSTAGASVEPNMAIAFNDTNPAEAEAHKVVTARYGPRPLKQK